MWHNWKYQEKYSWPKPKIKIPGWTVTIKFSEFSPLDKKLRSSLLISVQIPKYMFPSINRENIPVTAVCKLAFQILTSFCNENNGLTIKYNVNKGDSVKLL